MAGDRDQAKFRAGENKWGLRRRDDTRGEGESLGLLGERCEFRGLRRGLGSRGLGGALDAAGREEAQTDEQGDDARKPPHPFTSPFLSSALAA